MTREQILADMLTMIEAMPDYYSLSALQSITEETNKTYTVLHLAEHTLGNGRFRLDFVVNRANTEDRFIVEVYADGTSGDFYNTFNKITDVVVTEYNGSQYDV